MRDDIKAAILQEIEWCKANPEKSPGPQFAEGFIAGLKQAVLLIELPAFDVE